MKMRSWALTMLCLLATLLITKGSAEQCGSQAGGALCPGGLCSTTPPPAAPSPLGDGDITDLITSSMFDIMLPNRNYSGCDSEDFYTYDAFITAAKSFPTFATTGDTDTRKRELAAFFAQTSHQTTANPPGGPYLWGYCHVKQINPQGDYCDRASEDQWPCAPGKQYYGRGPMQLSYNFNYGPAGEALGLEMELLTSPDKVETDSVISFKTALWFWMTPQPPKPSCHDVITGNWKPTAADISANRFPGYGVITNIINGGLECGNGQDARDEDRIGFYKRYCSDEIFDVRTGDNLDCNNQAPFGTVPALDSM